MAGAGGGEFLEAAAVYLGAAVVAVPLFKRLQLGSVLGYLAAGVVIGPHALGLAADEEAVQRIGEFGVVLLLFVIGLELKPERLWRLRFEVFGLGAAQVLLTGLVIGLIGYGVGLWGFELDWREAVVAGAGLALSSTAYAIQILREKGLLATPHGDRSFAILLFQDIAIVPLIALVAILAPIAPGEDGASGGPAWWLLLKAVAAVGAVYFFGRYAVKPLFHVIAQVRADETFTAAALLVVVASALAMDAVGLSMALGAFLAGVLLAETEFRHQLETDIEPFRGLLMGLFFIAVGMSLQLDILADNVVWILFGVLILVTLKAALLFALARIAGSSVSDSLRIGAVLSQGGEFGFVLFSQAAASGLLDAADASLLNATVILSMATTPFAMLAADRLAARLEAARQAAAAQEGGAGEGSGPGFDVRRDVHGEIDAPIQRPGLAMNAADAPAGPTYISAPISADGASERPEASPGAVIIAGFGRTGQVVARIMRLRGYELTLIDNNPRRIRFAETFGAQVFFGDARRLDTMATAGAEQARAIMLCINDRDGERMAVERLRARFGRVPIFAMTYDRFSKIEMEKAGAAYVERETFEASVSLACKALETFGDGDIIEDLVEEFRRRDQQLIRLQAEFGANEGLRKLREGFSLQKER